MFKTSKTLIALLLSFVFSLTSLKAQSLTDTTKTVPDTTQPQFSILELRTISDYLKEVEFRREKDSLLEKQIGLYGTVVDSLKQARKLDDMRVKNLEKEVELIKPSWWDHFYVGVVTGVVTTGGIMFLILTAVK